MKLSSLQLVILFFMCRFNAGTFTLFLFFCPASPVSLTVTPKKLQFFKFDNFSVSCVDEEKEQEGSGLGVMKRTADGEVCLGKIIFTPHLRQGLCIPALLDQTYLITG